MFLLGAFMAVYGGATNNILMAVIGALGVLASLPPR